MKRLLLFCFSTVNQLFVGAFFLGNLFLTFLVFVLHFAFRLVARRSGSAELFLAALAVATCGAAVVGSGLLRIVRLDSFSFFDLGFRSLFLDRILSFSTLDAHGTDGEQGQGTDKDGFLHCVVI